MPQYSEEPCDPSEEFDHLFQFLEDENEDDDVGFAWKITRFETTPLMSTYLVAYANGGFQHLESAFCSPLSGRTVPLRIYSKHQWRHSGYPFKKGTFVHSYPQESTPCRICARTDGTSFATVRADLRYRISASQIGHSCCKFDLILQSTGMDPKWLVG